MRRPDSEQLATWPESRYFAAMSFLESIKLAWAAWDHTLSSFRIWIVAALPALAFNFGAQWITLGDPFGLVERNVGAFLGWIAISAIVSVYLAIPVVTGWHARNLVDSPPEPIPIRLTWTRREWRYLLKLVLAFLAILLMSIVVGVLTAFSDGNSFGAKAFLAALMTCGLWLTFAVTARLWMALGGLLIDPPPAPVDVTPKTVATVLCATLVPGFVLGLAAEAFDSIWPLLFVGAVNGIVSPLASVAALGALQRRFQAPPTIAPPS
jgi:hypothetical protein